MGGIAQLPRKLRMRNYTGSGKLESGKPEIRLKLRPWKGSPIFVQRVLRGRLDDLRGANCIALPGGRGRPPHTNTIYSELMLARNSPLDLALLSLSIRSSMASTGDSGFNTRRRTQMRVKSSLGISNSSFLVPER